jgi:hypothetical protein
MSIEEPPEYSISEFLLAALFMCGGLACLIWAAHEFSVEHPFAAMKGAGLALILFAGSVDPLRLYGDLLAFPFRFVDSAGRDTRLTMLAAVLGSLLFVAGALLGWLAG